MNAVDRADDQGNDDQCNDKSYYAARYGNADRSFSIAHGSITLQCLLYNTADNHLDFIIDATTCDLASFRNAFPPAASSEEYASEAFFTDLITH